MRGAVRCGRCGCRRARRRSRGCRRCRGYRARVVGIEQNNSGRTVVRVELVALRMRRLEYTEDNHDGMWTQWRGIRYDANNKVVEDDEETFEAVIQPAQVKLEWNEAVIAAEVRRLNVRLDRPGRDRLFGGS